jgi:hypothetical protein
VIFKTISTYLREKAILKWNNNKKSQSCDPGVLGFSPGLALTLDTHPATCISIPSMKKIESGITEFRTKSPLGGRALWVLA